jgi:hypothetical protein
MVSQQSFFPEELLLHILFRNRYFILSKVGEGGYGSVYKARDTQSNDRLVAIMVKHKLLRVPISIA